jgi:hypothetical protein
MDEFEKIRDELLKKQLGPDYKQFDMPRQNMPTENDMGPLPTPPANIKKVKKEKTAIEVERKKKGGKVKAKCMARGGGIEVRGKTKGRFV